MTDLKELSRRAEDDCRKIFERIDAVSLENTGKILGAFQKRRVSHVRRNHGVRV